MRALVLCLVVTAVLLGGCATAPHQERSPLDRPGVPQTVAIVIEPNLAQGGTSAAPMNTGTGACLWSAGLQRVRRRQRTLLPTLNRCNTPTFSINSVTRAFGLRNSTGQAGSDPSAWLIFRPNPASTPKKGAVHEQALGKFEHEVGITLLTQTQEQGLEVNAHGEVRAPGNLEPAGKAITNQD